jgi:hypothetical protein
MISRTLLMAFALTLVPIAGSAQDPDRQVPMLRAAVNAVLDMLPPGRVAFDASSLTEAVASRTTFESDRIVQVDSAADVLDCSPLLGLRECTMRGAGSLLQLRGVSEGAGSSRVLLELLTPSGAGIYFRGVAVTLQERAGSWVVLHTRVIYAS